MAATAAALVVLFLVIGVLLPDDAPITEAYVRPDGAQLEVSVGTCNQDPRVTAVETAEEVRLSSNEKLPRGGSNDCQDFDLVTLSAPLGDRPVVDEATGKEVRDRNAE